MMSRNLENLVRARALKPEPADQQEFDNLLRSGKTRLKDARHVDLSVESRFDLAYNAAHALALAALRWKGYRTEKRYYVFQCIPHTVGLGPDVWKVLALCHDRRNKAEYEGVIDIDEQLLRDLIIAAEKLQNAVKALGPVP
jgi:hypothetical protein